MQKADIFAHAYVRSCGVWFVDLGTHALTMAASPDGSHWAPSVRLTGVGQSAISLSMVYEPEQADPFRLFYLTRTASGREIRVAESADGVSFHNDKSALSVGADAEGLAVGILPGPASSYRLYFRDQQAGQIVYATSSNGRDFASVDAIEIPATLDALALRPAKLESPLAHSLRLWTLDAHDRAHLLTSSNGNTWALADRPLSQVAKLPTAVPVVGAPGEWSFFSPMDNWQQEGWIVFSNSGTVPDGVETAVIQNPEGTVAVRDRRPWGNFYITHDTAWTVPFTVELRVRLDDAQGTDGDAGFPKFTVACLMRNESILGPQTWQPAFGKERFGAWSLATGPWAACKANEFHTFTIVCRFDEKARLALARNPEDSAAKVNVCVFDVYTNRQFATPALSFHNMGFMGWHSVDADGRLDIGFPWPSSGQITLDWVRSGSGIILDPTEPPQSVASRQIVSKQPKTVKRRWQVADSPDGPWIGIRNAGDLAMLAPLGHPRYFRPAPN
jgi:hypothetical protein